MKLFDVYPLFDIEPTSGRGATIFDREGKQYLDFYGGHAVISIGHTHPHYVRSIESQLHRLSFYSNSVQNRLQMELASKLGRLSNCEDYRLFMCNSGAEAIENALKLASFHTGKMRILAFKGAFHGRTSAAVNITDNPKIKAPINATFPVDFIPMNDEKPLEKELKKGDVAAVITECLQGVGGVMVQNVPFLKKIRTLCSNYKAVMIADEIQSGYGRSGKFFAFQHAEIVPDLITIAKGMGNGFPIGGVLIGPQFEASHGLLGTTFGGNHLACAAGLAVLEVIETEQLVEKAAQSGQYLMKHLKKHPKIKEVRGKGLMIGLEMEQPVAALRKRILMEGHIFTGSSSNPKVIRLLPPLNVEKKELKQFIDTFNALA